MEDTEGLSRILEKSTHTFFAFKYLIIAIAADIGLILITGLAGYSGMLYSSTDYRTNKSESSALIYCLVFAFAFGFLIAYFAFNLLKTTVIKSEPIETGLLSNFSNDANQGNKMAVYFVSATGGLLNLGIVIFVYFYFNGE